ncbi:hypothetical protein ACFQ46_12705 [Kineococcus sp. GCM10028916]|uniref:hypothetical protein n=1 Tax=Kineococcus sp. GCM10028916 TaxID=3273394 RepID=UPI003641C033
MFGGLVVFVPLIVLLGGAAAALVSVRRAAQPWELPLPAAEARRRDARSSVVGVTAGLGAAVVVVAVGLLSHSPALVVTGPLVGAALHAVVAYLHETAHPRPTGRVRSAKVVTRSIGDSAPPVLTVLGALAGFIIVAACVGGIVVNGASDQYVWERWNGVASGGLFPGGALALPVLAAAFTAIVVTGAVLHRVPARPAVPTAPAWVDDGLRRTSAHRVVRVTTAALLGTAGVLVLLWSHFAAVYGLEFTVNPDPADQPMPVGPLEWLVEPFGLGGLSIVLVGLVVLAVPARGLRNPVAVGVTTA